MASQTSLCRTTVLVVQRNRLAGRALGRYLCRHYGAVLVAHSPDEAERLLSGVGHQQPTHVVCGQEFGAGEERGQDFIRRLRQSYPGIERAVLASGASAFADVMTGVDGVFAKPAEPALLLALLGVVPSQDYLPDPNASSVTPSYQHESIMKNSTPKVHNLSTLKQRLFVQPSDKPKQESLSVAQGFAVG